MQPVMDAAQLLSCSFCFVSLSLYVFIYLSFSCSTATKMTCYSFLKRGPRCGNACDTDSHSSTRRPESTDRKIAGCQDRPAFEMIFGFGPSETRIAILYNTVVNASLNRAYECVRTYVANLFSLSFLENTARAINLICQIYQRWRCTLISRTINVCISEYIRITEQIKIILYNFSGIDIHS